MSWFDIIIILILLGAFVRGVRKGFTTQLAGLVAVIAGAIFAGKTASLYLPFILKTTNISANIAVVLSYILAFAIIFFGIKLIGKMLDSLFHALHLSFINKILGAILGVITASIVLSILLNLTLMLDTKEEIMTSKIKSESYFYSKIQMVIPTIVPYLKKEVWEKYNLEQNNRNDEKLEKAEEEAPSLRI